jgi:hypothetical protein
MKAHLRVRTATVDRGDMDVTAGTLFALHAEFVSARAVMGRRDHNPAFIAVDIDGIDIFLPPERAADLANAIREALLKLPVAEEVLR